LIRAKYIRGPGFVAIVSAGHANNRQVCEAECAILVAAALAIEQLAAWNPKEIAIEGLAHTGPRKSIDVASKTTAVAQNPKRRKVKSPQRKRRT